MFAIDTTRMPLGLGQIVAHEGAQGSLLDSLSIFRSVLDMMTPRAYFLQPLYGPVL